MCCQPYRKENVRFTENTKKIFPFFNFQTCPLSPYYPSVLSYNLCMPPFLYENILPPPPPSIECIQV